ncbi:glycosyltransferase family 4 protein [Chitinophaga sp. G-6-1-13]|uniref:Glycosyltransferase family 4 protein n=1 Tax=Chitinophaga fulva TaxID=2728842 RepID=A0A848GK89_9BACT|nr:glycosyltransferase family 4 protein [Chitinophaga fulva]NML37263.1 glycosyltransferase family 4 protein [Chitinophaga fulva]
MKVLLTANGNFKDTYGGGQVYLNNLANEMIHQERDIAIISFVAHCTADIALNYKGVPFYEVEASDQQRIKTIIQEIAPDLIHIHFEKAMMVAIAAELNIPAVVTVHHGGILCPVGTLLNYRDEICSCKVEYQNCLRCVLHDIRGGDYVWPILKRIPVPFQLRIGKLLQHRPFIPFITSYGQAALSISDKMSMWATIASKSTYVMASSEAIAEVMLRNGLPQQQLKILPLGIVMSSKSFPAPAQRPLKFFYTGRICYSKGIHVLLAAFSLIKSDCELHMIGSERRKTAVGYMNRLKRRYRKDKRIYWYGHIKQEQLPVLMADFHVMVHPAIGLEVYGLAIAEALSLGKPVLASRCGGAEMQITSDINGWLVPPNDIAALKSKMEFLCHHPEVINRISKQTAHNVINIENHVNTLYKEVFEVISER